MTKRLLYRYLGTNGVLDTPIHVPDTYHVRMVELVADSRHILTNGERKQYRVLVPEDEVKLWTEVPLDAVE